MYYLILVLLIGAGAWVIKRGLARSSYAGILGGACIIIFTAGFFGLMSLWGEMLWFEALGYERRFWVFLVTQTVTSLLGAIVAIAFTLASTWLLGNRPLRNIAVLIAAAGGVVWGLHNWSEPLIFLNRVDTGVQEPVFMLDIGFYLFELPFYEKLYDLAFIGTLAGLGACIGSLFKYEQQSEFRISSQRSDGLFLPLLISSALLFTVLAFGNVLSAFQLLFSEMGGVRGAGWTNIHIHLLVYLSMAVLLIILSTLSLFGSFRQWISHKLVHLSRLNAPVLNTLGMMWVIIGTYWVVALLMLPSFSQSLVVEPNEITFEKPYIERNINFTLYGFHLNKVEEKKFTASEEFTREMVKDNQDLLSEVRLWDWRALDAVYKQFQEIRLYYEFNDVDLDRYRLGDQYRQVMVSARELAPENLAPQSQTFVNRRFKYTHGYGLTMATVSDFTKEGLPNLLIKDIPPQSTHPKLEVIRPQIYYGELTTDPVVVNSDEQEFDYPTGEQNRYIHYPGKGGVLMDNLWRKFLYGWKFDGTPFLFSSYPNPQSRVMFHREIRERVKHLAPFLKLDEDPYIVLVEGRLYWIIDAYTTSSYLPYSEPFSSEEFVEYRNGDQTESIVHRTAEALHGANYVRNSVKAVVDAFEGSVEFYIFEPQDPIIQVWQRILPDLFKQAQDMPDPLRAHIRYPQDFLLVQGLVYAKYHMQDPEVFYNQEDLWVRATEKHYGRVQPVEPYYIMWKLPHSEQAEFVLIQPFTPRNRQVLIGWIAGLSDGENYGRFLAYKFPKEKRILGPQQVETKIDQDSFLSGQLTLWDQRGSNVIRGNVLAIPIDNTIIYVEPIYLQADTAAYPELRLVVVMHGDNMSYAESFDEALMGLFETKPPRLEKAAQRGVSMGKLGQQLNQTFDAYLRALGNKEFDAAATQLKQLSDLIDQAAMIEDGRTPSNVQNPP